MPESRTEDGAADALPLYAAYGSNLSHAQMALRCPGATPVGALALPGWRLVLGRFARIAPDPAASCPVGLWRITAAHLAALDRFEGHPLVYRRRPVALPRAAAGAAKAWIYLEVPERPGPPAPGYVDRLRAGYADFGLDPAPLEAALREAGVG